MNAFIPYGIYWSSPFAKWQGTLANLNALPLAAAVGKQALAARGYDLAAVDLAILGITNPQKGRFYGLPWVTGMMGIDRVAGPTVQQACATSVRALQMAAQEVACGTATSALLVMADRQSNGPVVYYPDSSGTGGYGITEHWVPDNMGHDPYAKNPMLQTGENVAARYGISTEEQHALKLHRYHQYQEALANDRAFQKRYMADVPVTDSKFRKQTGTLSTDEGIFPTTAEGLAKLKPVKEGGTVTFGGQTHPADGNAGAIVTTRERARAVATDPGIEVEILGFGMARVEAGYMPMAPSPAAFNALKNAGLSISDVAAIKTHNPFAVNDIALARDTGFAWERMNNYGSSISWRHRLCHRAACDRHQNHFQGLTMTTTSTSSFSAPLNAWLVDGVRTPMVDYCGPLGHVSPTDMGIKVARAVLERSGVPAADVGSVITGSMAQADFDAFVLPRHIGLYAGVPQAVPAILVQRICGTGFELFRQAADQIALGYTDVALVVGTESMTRNPIAAYTHRTGFKLGAPVEFKDFLMEALIDTAGPVTMIETAENLAKKYGITREDVDAYASQSFARALRAQEDGFLAGEIVPVTSEKFELAGYATRGITLPRKVAQLDRDTHPRPSPVEALAALRTVYPGGVQTAGNSSALVDGAVGAVVASDAYVQQRGLKPLARLRGVAAVGVAPEY